MKLNDILTDDDDWEAALAKSYGKDRVNRSRARRQSKSDRFRNKSSDDFKAMQPSVNDRRADARDRGEHTSDEWFTPEELGLTQDQFDAIKRERESFSDIEQTFKDAGMFREMLIVLAGKGNRNRKQKNIRDGLPELMQSVGLLNPRGGATNRAIDYLKLVLKPNVGSDTDRHRAGETGDSIKKTQGKEGNFPPGVYQTISSRAYRDSGTGRAEVKDKLLQSVRNVLFGLQQRQDYNQSRRKD